MGNYLTARGKQEFAEAIMEACRFHEYLDKTLALATATNVYIDRTEPFKLAKDESQRERLGTILYTCAEAVRIVMLHLQPVMPETAAKALEMLGLAVPEGLLSEEGKWGRMTPGTKMQKCDPLFPRKQ